MSRDSLSRMRRPAAFVLPSFATRLGALDAAAWDRIEARVPDLAGDGAAALWNRGQRIGAGLPDLIPSPVRAAVGMLRAVRSEFTLGRPTLAPPSAPAFARALSAADRQVRQMLEGRQATHPGAVAAVLAVVPFLASSTLVEPEVGHRLYAAIEPEIPYASLERLAPEEAVAPSEGAQPE